VDTEGERDEKFLKSVGYRVGDSPHVDGLTRTGKVEDKGRGWEK